MIILREILPLVRRMQWSLALLLPSMLLLVPPCRALEAQDVESGTRDEKSAAVMELEALLDELSVSETPPGDDEIAALYAASESLVAWLEAARVAPESERPDEARLREARKLLQRVSAMLLLPSVHELRTRLDSLEAAKEPLTQQDLEILRPMAEELLQAVTAIEEEWDPGSLGAAPVAAKARDVLRRFSALEVTVATSGLIAEDERLETADSPPTVADLEPAMGVAAALEARLERISSASDSDKYPKKVIEKARVALERTATLELLPLVERMRPWVEEMESRRTALTESDLERVLRTADELAERMEAVRPGTLDAFDRDAPPAVARARAMLRRLVSLELQPHLESGARALDRLDGLGRPPTEAELAPLREEAARLRAEIRSFEERPVSESPDAEPDVIRQARELLWRFALIDLSASVARMEPLVVELEGQSKPPTAEEQEELQRLAEDLRPKLRLARGKDEAEVPEEEKEGGLPDIVRKARELMTRADALRPTTRGTSEEQRDAPVNRPFMRRFRFYGSLRLRTFLSSEGFSRVDDNTSRIGISGGVNPTERVGLYGRLEVAINPLSAIDGLPDTGDAGQDFEGLKNLFPPRLAYVGAELPWGDIRLGKQWSSYWDIAVFSDQLPAYTGTTCGTFNAGDGSVSGTGRTDQTIQYRGDTSSFSYSGQVQARNLTENDQPVADSFGGSVSYARQDGIDVGGAFSVVRDGVDDPDTDEPKSGDQAWIVGARTKDEERYVGATLAYTRNHERDDQGQFFDGLGFEFYADRLFIEKLRARLAVSGLFPINGYAGDYRQAYLVIGASYDVVPGFRIFLLPRFSASLNADGSRRGDHAVAVLLLYNF